MTELIRTDAPRASGGALLATYGLVIGLGFFLILLLWGALNGASQQWQSFWMGAIVIILGVVLDIYRREFLPDELIHKKRRPKIVIKRDIR